MLSQTNISILSLALSLTTLLAFLTAAWMLRQSRQRAECDTQRMFEQLDLVRAELMLLADRVQGIQLPAQQIIQQRTAPVEIKAPPAVAAAPAPRGYEVAARLARGGATCDELVSSCGLSRHEAELLMRLNKAEGARSKPAPAAAVSAAPTKADGAQRRNNEAMRARLAAVV